MVVQSVWNASFCREGAVFSIMVETLRKSKENGKKEAWCERV